MPYREHAPGPELRSWVECLWTRTVPVGGEPRRSRILPDGCADILFSLGAPFGPAAHGPMAWVVGTQRRPKEVHVPPGASIVAVRFRPGGGGPFLGLPLRQTRDADVPLPEIWPRRAGPLLEELVSGPSPERVGRLRELLRRLGPARPVEPLVAAAVTRIVDSRGRVRIEELAESLGVGTRRLQRRFAADVGVSPKRLCRIVRARFTLRLADRGVARDPLDLVARSGCHDQAHLTRELRELAGTTPGRILDRG